MAKIYLYFPFSLLLIHYLLPCLTMTTTNITKDQEALLSLKAQITSDPYQILARNWSVASAVCQWIGITCGSRHHRVTALNISNMDLKGTISPYLGNLSFLVSVDLSANNFHGNLPDDLAKLHRLKVLDFSFNSISGELPSWFGSLHRLQILALRNNSFTGIIPPSISNISNLEQLFLSSNPLQGTIPAEIGNLQHLKVLVFAHNKLSGSLPLEVFNISTVERLAFLDNNLSGNLPAYLCHRLRRLTWLNLAENKFNGEIPSNISECSQLQVLSLSVNNFTGFIPKEIGKLKLLEKLYLGENNLKGAIPEEFSNLTLLTLLSIGNSNLTGVIPQELGNLQNLEQLYLPFNSLSGSIPVGIFNHSMIRIITLSVNLLSGNLPSSITYELPNLERLYLSSNQLEGVIPPSLSNASKLTHLDLSANKFMGSIPGTIGDFRLLVWLDLSENNLTSDSSSPKLEIISSLTNCKDLRGVSLYKNPLDSILPDSIGNLSTSIERVYAYNCKIKGSLPDGIGNLTSLLVINLSGNLLSGSLPTTIKNLQNLQVLYLGENKLSKVVLDNFCGSQSLYDILLSQNQFSGSIPECLGNVTSLRYLDLDSNRLNSPIPRNLWNLKDLLGLNLSSNSLSGSLPLEFGNLKVARYIDLSMNKFSGDLPISVEGLKDLVQLSLAKNALQGSIRESFGEMISLVSLDLSHNNLSGLIPKSLEKLQYLTYLNVSFNNLRGEIPMGGPFQNFTSKSFIFNEALCGAPRFNVPPCTSTSSHRSRRKMVHRTIFIVLGTLAIVGAIALGFGWLTYKKKDKVPHRTNSFSIVLQERISYYELLSATNGYDQSNLLGTGSFGSVYRGTLNDGRVVAVKVFNLQLEGTVKSFEVECQILRNLRHRNLTKVISSCSNPDFKALVLEFMPNGSLQKWLYSSNYFLDIVQRLDIMIDTACALDYLHSGYSTPIVHCDLKPDNILLDHKMVAHVSDFGIAKLLGNEDSTTFTETIATFGYVAPEYGQGGSVSTKCDVYSYGIMLIEVFTRVQPNDERFEGNLTLRKWVNDSMPNSVVEVIDANLLRTGEDYSTKILDCLSSIMVVALNCSKESPKEKMNMGDVIGELNKIKLELLTYYGGKKL